MKTHLRREDKKYVKSGIQNSNLFRHFRPQNPLWVFDTYAYIFQLIFIK